MNRWEENFNSSIVLAATALDPWARKKIGDNAEWRLKAKVFIRKYAVMYLQHFNEGKILSCRSSRNLCLTMALAEYSH